MKKTRTTYQKGLWAEECAKWLLRLKGYKILCQRYKTPFGEIDLICRKSQTLVCVEVKYRPDEQQALEAVLPIAQKRIIAAAEAFRARHPRYAQDHVRFDIVTVSPAFLTRHHKNAWYDS